MKKTLAVLIVAVSLFGLVSCAGMNASVPVNIATDIAFVTVLQNNPSFKAPVVAGLTGIKVYLAGNVTYDDLIIFINKQFGGKYSYVGVILMAYLDTDKPLSTTWLNMSDAYKQAIIVKIDRLLILASM